MSSRTDHPPSTAAARGQGVFATTHWSVVLRAGREDASAKTEALNRLCQVYWHPLYVYARRQGKSPHDAQDLVQGFFAHFLQRQGFDRADPHRGRFRSFLLASFNHYVAHEWEKARARKRGGGAEIVPLAFDTAEAHYVPADAESPDKAFDRQWALALLDLVLGRLRAEHVESGKEHVFLVLRETLLGGRSEIPYRDLATRLGMSEGAVKVAAHRLRQRYRLLLRQEIANTVENSDQVEEELRHLFAALAS